MKTVTKLLENISKARDILDTGSLDKVKNNLYFFEKLRDDIVRQGKKYIEHEGHQLDFNSEDVKELSNGLFDLETKLIKSSYSQLFKRLSKNTPITMEHFNALSQEVANKMLYDKRIRPIADDLAYWAVVIWLWSESEYKQDFMTQITNHIRSFI